MAVVPQIQVCVVTSILQNVVYATPARACLVTSSVLLEISMDGTTFTAMAAGSVTAAQLISATFIRCPTANALVIFKPND